MTGNEPPAPPATPPAEPNGGQAPPANDPGKTYTQAELDSMFEERVARERKKYADYNDLKKQSAELAELKKSQMSELEKLQTALAEKDKALQEREAELTGIKLERVKTAKLAEAGVPLEWSDSVHGSTEEEITASVLKLAGRLKVSPGGAAQGAGKTGLNEPGNSFKMTRAELAEKSKDRAWYEKNREAIMQAMATGDIR